VSGSAPSPEPWDEAYVHDSNSYTSSDSSHSSSTYSQFAHMPLRFRPPKTLRFIISGALKVMHPLHSAPIVPRFLTAALRWGGKQLISLGVMYVRKSIHVFHFVSIDIGPEKFEPGDLIWLNCTNITFSTRPSQKPD